MFRKMLIVSVGVILLLGCSPMVDQKKYENLYHAAKAIDGAVAVGVNYQKFGELLQNLSTEISIANDKAKSDIEKELLKKYLEVLIAYQESAIVWKNNIECAQRGWPQGKIPLLSEIRPIVTKYSLPTETYVFKYLKEKSEVTSDSENAIRVIWGKAHEHLEKANKMYFGQ
jgi:hypothetical protein